MSYENITSYFKRQNKNFQSAHGFGNQENKKGKVRRDFNQSWATEAIKL